MRTPVLKETIISILEQDPNIFDGVSIHGINIILARKGFKVSYPTVLKVMKELVINRNNGYPLANNQILTWKAKSKIHKHWFFYVQDC